MKKLQIYMLIFSILMIQVAVTQGMHVVVRRLQQKSQRPVGSRLYNQGEGDHFTAYMVAKSKEKNPVKLSKMIDIPSTLPQSWCKNY